MVRFFLLSLFLGASIIYADANQQIALYTYCTPSHRVLLDEWFLPSIKDDYAIKVIQGEQKCSRATYGSDGWNETFLARANIILEAIEDNWGGFFVFSDVDIQFFKPTKPIILELMQEYDIVFQKTGPTRGVCPGFFACKCNEKTKKLWQAIKESMIEKKTDDQDALNHIIFKQNNPFGLKWANFSSDFYHTGLIKPEVWHPGVQVHVPKDIVLHHACYTIGLKNKIELLKYVKRKIIH